MTQNLKPVFATFTKNGVELALKIANIIGGEVFAPERFCVNGVKKLSDLKTWTAKYFYEASALIFISACGIAVRSIAPHVKNKFDDPAVIVIDERANYVIPVLSGHIGGANELAKNIAEIIHAQPVITTASDVNNLVPVDEWAVKNNCVIENPVNIKKIAAHVLENHYIGIAVTDENIKTPYPITLILRPRDLYLGAGCNKNTDPEIFYNAALKFLKSSGVSNLSLAALCSIDLKAQEPAMLNFASVNKIPFMTFSANELNNLQGTFTKSEYVLKITGVDNICERSAMLAAGENAVLLRSKFIIDGITFALARSISN